jgi:hypothetical protein
MRRRGRTILIAGVLTLLALPSDPVRSEDGASRTEPHAEKETVTPVGHEEVPVKPPAAPVRRESQARSPRAIVMQGLHQSIQVNVDELQKNIVGDAANEPSIAIDPTDPDNIVIGWRQFDSVTSDFRQAGYAYSHDGGATWTFPGSLDPGQFRSDPVLAADSLGDFFYYSLSSTTTTEYFVSTDKGVTWTAPTYSPGGDKNWQTIDITGGLGDGHIYAIWNSQFTCCDPNTDFTRSTDSAISWEGPYVLPRHPKWGTNAVGPDGELYIVGTNLLGSNHLILRSSDARDSLVTPTFPLTPNIDLGGVTATNGTPNPGGLMGQVWVAVDHSSGPTRGYVYVLGSVDPAGGDPLDVHIIRSADGGQTWSTPLRVNDDPGGTAWQWFGTMSVSPEGRIDVVWNDTRKDPSAQTSELYYAWSTDAGSTFSSGLAVSPPFNSLVGHPVQNKIGDYYHMISDTDGASLAYSATFNGEQDVYFLRVGDCNGNGIHDSLDLSGMTSDDCNTNGIPDECEEDCNGNGIADGCDISGGTSDDCNGNAIPDECDISSGVSDDCDFDGLLDECEVTYDLESAQGFTVGDDDDTATIGVWVQVDPIGTGAQPEDDHTPGGGTTCFVTGQGTPGGGLGEADVDGGKTTLFSPSLDLTGMTEPWIGYWRWYSNNTGGAPGADVFTVDMTADAGGSWSNVETVGPSGAGTTGGWFFHTFRVSDVITSATVVQLRFVAADLDAGSVVEAAIDDLVVIDCTGCTLAVPAEVANLRLSLSDTVASLSWNAVTDAASYDVYRGTQRDASDLGCYLTGLATTSTTDDGSVPDPGNALFYVTTAVNCAGESPLGESRTPSALCP